MTKEQEERYFDWAASAPLDEALVSAAFNETLRVWGNPSSAHRAGKEADAALNHARKKAAAALEVCENHIYFTSGGTESNQIPLLSVLNRPQKGCVLISALEHPAIREQAAVLKKCGWTVEPIPSDKNGIVQPEAVQNLLSDRTVLVCVMAVNNEMGAIQPIYEIADMLNRVCAGKRRPLFHVDCVQAAGKIPLRLLDSGIDSAAFSAHKIGGPRGIGILYAPKAPEPFLRGGGQENGLRSGTENLFGALAFANCLERYCISEKNEAACRRFEAQIQYAAHFIEGLSAIPGCALIPEQRLIEPERYSPWIVQAAFKNIPGQVMLRALDAEGFCISTGSACSARKQNRPILDAMRVSRSVSETAVRFSFGPATTHPALNALLDALKDICQKFSGGA